MAVLFSNLWSKVHIEPIFIKQLFMERLFPARLLEIYASLRHKAFHWAMQSGLGAYYCQMWAAALDPIKHMAQGAKESALQREPGGACLSLFSLCMCVCYIFASLFVYH